MEVVRWLPSYLDFRVYDPAKTQWNDIPGLFVFTLQDPTDRSWQSLYVGQTASFSDTLPNHEMWPRAAQLGATHIHARWEPSEPQRTAIQNRLIQAFDPPLNMTE